MPKRSDTASSDLAAAGPTSGRGADGARGVLARMALRLGMLIYGITLALGGLLGGLRKRPAGGRYEVLATGTFYTDNWLVTHLAPLASSQRCTRVRMVAAAAVPDIPGVEPVYPPPWLKGLVGAVAARLLVFAWLAVRDRPHVLAGFHLLLNGLAAILLARTLGVYSVYFCGGGPREVEGGGYLTENRLFNKLPGPDRFIEKRLLRAVGAADATILMGSRAVEYFERHAPSSTYYVLPGGFDGNRFRPADTRPRYDLITVGRLSPVKRVDVFLHAIRFATEHKPDISALIVGEGPSMGELRDLAERLELGSQVSFVGWQTQVEDWLRDARVFVLTSESEGVSQAMIQAMLCGLPAVVSDVGDLGDVVVQGVNGYLVGDPTLEAFADRFVDVLTSDVSRERMAASARETASRYDRREVANRWNTILDRLPAVRSLAPTKRDARP